MNNTPTQLRVTKFIDFKKTIEINLGHKITDKDIAVISVNDKPFAQSVAALDLSAFISKMIKHNKDHNITSNDVAVITADDLNNAEQKSEIKNTGSKFKIGN